VTPVTGKVGLAAILAGATANIPDRAADGLIVITRMQHCGDRSPRGHGEAARVSLRPLTWYQVLRFGLFTLAGAMLGIALVGLAVLGYRVDGEALRTALVGAVIAATPLSTLASYFLLRHPRERAAVAVTARAARWADSAASAFQRRDDRDPRR